MSRTQNIFSLLKKNVIMATIFLAFGQFLKAPIDTSNPQTITNLIAALQAQNAGTATPTQKQLISQLQQPDNSYLQTRNG